MVTLDELKTYLGVAGVVEDGKLSLILNSAIDIVRRYTGRKWEYGEHTETVFFDEGLGFVAETPLEEIRAVDAIDGELAVEGFERNSGLIELVEPYTGEADVNYIGGETPDEIKFAVLRLAEYFYNRPAGVKSENVGDLKAVYELPEVYEILERYRSVWL